MICGTFQLPCWSPVPDRTYGHQSVSPFSVSLVKESKSLCFVSCLLCVVRDVRCSAAGGNISSDTIKDQVQLCLSDCPLIFLNCCISVRFYVFIFLTCFNVYVLLFSSIIACLQRHTDWKFSLDKTFLPVLTQ